MAEYIDIVDEFNRVLRSGEREQVHKDKLLHRAVHIFLFNMKGELFVQKRAMTKKEHPWKYDSSAAGHLDAGEGYDESAVRELEEELGIKAPLKRLMIINACSEMDNEFVYFYVAMSDAAIKMNEDEIEDGYFWSLDEIKHKISVDKDAFTPAFVLLFNDYLKLIRIVDLLT